MRRLRSRRLAVVLILMVVGYSLAMTMVPQGDAANAKVQAWAERWPPLESLVRALGLHHAYSTPLFIGLMALLACSTAACAWERTRRASRISRSFASSGDQHWTRLKERPQLAVPLSAGIPPDRAMSAVAEELAGAGLRVRPDAGRIAAESGRWALWGSPVFHWAIVALVLVTGLGRATRSEGGIVLPLNQRVPEVHEAYSRVSEGPWFGERHSGIELVALEVDKDYKVGSVEYGPTPRVAAYRDGIEVAREWVRPNNPLRIGNLMVHMSGFGPAVTLALEIVGGGESGRQTFALELSKETSSGTEPQEFDLPDYGAGSPLRGRIQVVVRRAGSSSTSQASQAIIETTSPGSSAFGPAVVVDEAQSVDLPGGARLRVAEVSSWVLVTVADDWSVPYIYALIVLIVLSLGVAVTVPTRRVSILLVQTGEGSSVHSMAWDSRKDPLFGSMVEDVVRRALSAEEV